MRLKISNPFSRLKEKIPFELKRKSKKKHKRKARAKVKITKPEPKTKSKSNRGSRWDPDSKGRFGFLSKFSLPSRKIHVPLILSVKRGIAALLMVVDFITFIMMMSENPAAIVFLLHSLILFDYIWKTRGGPAWT